ncbi:MAG: MotA/TolQ/ExbB proton channel family protein [Leptospiraceae bacterium]|nr:MotA/TolQ/ExbB proton channel family protein [Leptospiraceae bacterium]MCP5513267.1 MotA/TolQ/ExbB proton channel family protein [Leptospiraceae bacterium]
MPLAKSNSIISSIPPETVPGIIILVSIIAFTIIIERSIYFQRFKTLVPDDLRTLKEFLRSGDWDKAIDHLKMKSWGPSTNVLSVAIEQRRRESEFIEDELNTEAYRQIFHMEKFLTELGTIATISPLLGVLGTVLGMIRSFAEGTGTKGAEIGISEALITTAMGLAVAIPSYIAYNILVRKKEEKITEMENLSSQVLGLLK